jgi:hypothetical protein
MKKLPVGLAAAALIAAAWFWVRPEPAKKAASASPETSLAREEVPASSQVTRRATALGAPTNEPAAIVTPLMMRARDEVSRATAELGDYLRKNPNRLHEMCKRGATPAEYAAEAARLRAAVAAIAGGPVGEVKLPAPDPGCRLTYDDWLSQALANTLLGGDLASREAFVRVQGGESAEDAHKAIGELIASSKDEQERISALVLLKRSDYDRFSLPVAAYADIAKKSPTEIQLLLDGHAFAPLPAETVADVRALVTDENQPMHVRQTALAALGHPGTASQLNEIVGALGADPGVTRDVLGEIAPAIAKCGDPCLGALEKLAASTDEGLRSVAYNAGLHAQGATQAAFRDAIRRTQSFGDVEYGAQETELRQALFN